MPDRPTSNFSRGLAAALRGFMRERDIRQSSLAESLERSNGYISQHLSGVRPPDTDMIDAVAELAGISSPRLYEELGRRMSDLSPDPPEATVDAIVERTRTAAREARKAKASKSTGRGRRRA